jgi:steroid 5-alpha reductase family enzyme
VGISKPRKHAKVKGFDGSAGIPTVPSSSRPSQAITRGSTVSGEDYRWPILRTRIPNPVAWQAFNLLFISIFQVGLLMLITLPMYALLRTGARPAGAGNAGFAALLAVSLALLCLETAADQQQWRFHRAKGTRVAAAKYPSYRSYQKKVSPVVPWFGTIEGESTAARRAFADGERRE